MKNASSYLLSLMKDKRISEQEILHLALSFLTRNGWMSRFETYVTRAIVNRDKEKAS